MLFRDLATLRTDAPVLGSGEELRWTGPTTGFARLSADGARLARAWPTGPPRLADGRG